MSARRLRSQIDISPQHYQLGVSVPSVPDSTTDTSVMAPARKKRKVNHPVEKFLCTTCDTERTSRMFPDYNPAVECEHLIHTCKECLKLWVEVQVEGAEFVRRTGVDVADSGELERENPKGEAEKDDENKIDTSPTKGLLFGVKCPHPDCEGVMRNVNVSVAATRKVYMQFQTAERKFIGDSTPGWRWCLGVGCRAGQVHQPLLFKKQQPEPELTKLQAKRPKKGGRKKKDDIVIYEDPSSAATLSDESTICTCYACGTRACVNCDRPYHDGETCAQFKFRTKDRLEEEDKALQTIRKSTKGCPNCAKRIEKNGGCPSMWCSQCRMSFCWSCETVYDRGYCKCNPAPPPPPPPEVPQTAPAPMPAVFEDIGL